MENLFDDDDAQSEIILAAKIGSMLVDERECLQKQLSVLTFNFKSFDFIKLNFDLYLNKLRH